MRKKDSTQNVEKVELPYLAKETRTLQYGFRRRREILSQV